MGNVIAPMILPIAGLALSLIPHLPYRENPIFAAIEARRLAEEAQRRAEQSAKEAHELAEQIRRLVDQNREDARARQEEADKAASRAIEETARMRAQMEEAVRAARYAQELVEEAANASREEAGRLAKEAEEEHDRSRKISEDAERTMLAIKEEAEKAQKVADAQRRDAEMVSVLAEERARTAAEETRKATEAKKEAERRLKEGIQPVVIPSAEEVTAAKRRIQYRKDCFHFAVAGISGSGKSSLVNACRGLSSQDKDAAAVGVTETTLEMARYPDPNPKRPFVWYDIPGAGTLKCHDWQYFNDQGLYVFDFLIVLFDNRFTMTDIAILVNARRFDIPTYIVRSKADQHIRNIMMEMGDDSQGDDQDAESRNKMYKAAHKQFIEKTRESVQANLKDANLPDQRVYIVSSGVLLSIVRNKKPKKTIDEVDLLSDLLNQVYSRRGIRLGGTHDD